MNKEIMDKWNQWVSERPESVQKLAKEVVPWKRYRRKGQEDIGNRYQPIGYYEEKDGSVTVMCEKTSELFPIVELVVGIPPEELEEVDERQDP